MKTIFVMMTNNSVWLIVFKTLLFAKLSVLLTGSKTQVYNHVQHSKNLNKFKIFGTGFLMQLMMKLLKKLDACKSVLILIMLLWTSEKKLFLGINQSGFRNFMLLRTLKLWKKGNLYSSFTPYFKNPFCRKEYFSYDGRDFIGAVGGYFGDNTIHYIQYQLTHLNL